MTSAKVLALSGADTTSSLLLDGRRKRQGRGAHTLSFIRLPRGCYPALQPRRDRLLLPLTSERKSLLPPPPCSDSRTVRVICILKRAPARIARPSSNVATSPSSASPARGAGTVPHWYMAQHRGTSPSSSSSARGTGNVPHRHMAQHYSLRVRNNTSLSLL